MTSIKKEKKTQESFWSENLTEYYLSEGIFLYALLYTERYTSTK